MTATADQAQFVAERAGLSARLNALARLVQIGSARRGSDGFSDDLLADAEGLLTRAGERLMLSAEHTVVALAGGTGSGKSSLFNKLSGADFSTVGVTRPVTSEAHACVWGVAGSGPLLEWLGVPRRYRYARSSALDSGEPAMNGLVLLDMPDHDSVMGHATGLVDRLVGVSDLMIWVLDPQKYADRAVHRRFLVPLAGHSEVIAVVLNQADLLTARAGRGLRARPAAAARLREPARRPDHCHLRGHRRRHRGAAQAADRGRVRPASLRGPHCRGRGQDGGAVPAVRRRRARVRRRRARDSGRARPGGLAGAFARAAGVRAIGDGLRSARELRALDYTGWPVSWMAERVGRRDPARKIRLGKIWDELRDVAADPSGAQQAEIDNSLTQLADQVTPWLPDPWSRTVRAAVRSRADQIPAALGTEIGSALPPESSGERWWRFAGVAQGLLLGCAVVGIGWFIALLAIRVAGSRGLPSLFTDLVFLPVSAAVVAVALAGGWLLARRCAAAVQAGAVRETDQLVEDIRDQMAVVAAEFVVAPAARELAEFDRFRSELEVAAGRGRLD